MKKIFRFFEMHAARELWSAGDLKMGLIGRTYKENDEVYKITYYDQFPKGICFKAEKY